MAVNYFIITLVMSNKETPDHIDDVDQALNKAKSLSELPVEERLRLEQLYEKKKANAMVHIEDKDRKPLADYLW